MNSKPTRPSQESPILSSSLTSDASSNADCINICRCGLSATPPLTIPCQLAAIRQNLPGSREESKKNMLEMLTVFSKIKSQAAQKQFLAHRPTLKRVSRCPTCNCFCLKRKASEMTDRSSEINSLVSSSTPPEMEVNGFKIPKDAWTKSVLHGHNPSSLRILHIALIPAGESKKIKVDLALVPDEIDVKPIIL